ncbi:MAG: hypothetical protein KC503_31885 [Myxococcales bacterium]|nr:hypothetical protein [Myxococcales bacterium]
MSRNEQDIRVGILNTLLSTPHRQLEDIYLVHQEMIEQDPRFYPHLAAWYFKHGEVRDHKDMFVICLVMSKARGHRDVGLALLRKLPPHQVARVVSFIRGTRSKRRVRQAQPQQRRGRRGRAQRAQARANEAQNAEPQVIEVKQGLFASPPRALRTEVERYLREREAKPEMFDNAVLHARKDLKTLYAVFHVKPGERAQAVLFDNSPPEDSKLYMVKVLAKASDPVEQAKLIAKHKVPYRVASTVIKSMTPAVIAALVDVMSPQELINNMGSLKRRGALDNAAIKKLVEKKLQAAKKDDRVQAYKAKEAIKAAGIGGELAEQLDDITEARIKAKGAIKRTTALLVDKSSSMEQAIELGRRLAAMVSAVMEADLYVYAFDTIAVKIDVPSGGADLKAWEQAFEGIRASGCTSCGVPLSWMQKRGERVEQIIMISDQEENSQPFFVKAFESYAAALAPPHVVFVRTRGASQYLENACQKAGIAFDAYQFGGDYYALPNLIPLLTQPSRLDLVMEIMDTPLPERRAS